MRVAIGKACSRISRHARPWPRWAPSHTIAWKRLATDDAFTTGRTKAAVSSINFSAKDIISDLGPNGLLEFDDDGSRRRGYPTVIQGARNNMQKFSHCVVLTQVGNFYELYFEQAEELGPLLGLKVGAKPTVMGPVPIAGFPVYQLDRYLKFLVQDHGRYVALSQETANDPAQRVKSGGLLFDRQVTRVITPGTLIDEQFLNPFEHNYILAVKVSEEALATARENMLELASLSEMPVGLAWLDLSSGDFFTQSTTAGNLASAITRVGPREIVLQVESDKRNDSIYKTMIQAEDHVITHHKQSEDFDWTTELSSLLDSGTTRPQDEAFSPEEELSAKLLVDYVKTQLPGSKLRLQAPIRRNAVEFMNIDRNSLRGLEITRTMRDGATKGSLLHAVNRAVTQSGARLLAQRLASPSMSQSVINDRLDLVDSFLSNPTLLERSIELLKKTSDTVRLLQKFSFGRGNADDLLGLSRTIAVSKYISNLLSDASSQQKGAMYRLNQRFDWNEPLQLAESISQAIDEDKLQLQQRNEESATAETVDQVRAVLQAKGQDEDAVAIQNSHGMKRIMKGRGGASSPDEERSDTDIWIMRRNASETLERLHASLEALSAEKTALAESLRQRLDANSLTLKFTPGLGHVCHVKGKDTKIDLTSLNARTVGSSKSTRSFYLAAWTTLGSRIEDAKLRIRGEEANIFQSLRSAVINALVPLRRNASLLDDLDVACSAARLATEQSLVRPILTHSTDTKIFAGRHVMVDAGLSSAGRSFTPNDCHLHPAERIWLITGPNMAGKSTFLRQTALISILAQTGMYVPAAYAEIGLVDAIYSRVGAADNLAQEQSTFMVEMLETAAILRGATRRSFVVMDEVGRGTTPEDGIAVGYAVLEHLKRVNGCRTLFATHFHELADMTEGWDGLACYCTDVKEETGGAFRYDHRLKRGVNRESHALKVAQLAGLPEEAIQTAKTILEKLRDARKEDT